mmetsp:Transcript_73682/g.204927  ORF Transcript_73682/g.204927 Transcript_73682/m.204927 type:complete len:362 (-) Transcript_73682:90-1175(-)
MVDSFLCSALPCGVREEDRAGQYDTVIPAIPSPLDIGLQIDEKADCVPMFSTAMHQPLLGVPLREGFLWHLSAEHLFEPVHFSLYVNGISFTTHSGQEASIQLSPFSLVRFCRFQAGEGSELKTFKISLLDQDSSHFFAVRGANARDTEQERSNWVLSISCTVLNIVRSLLPLVPMSCDPLPFVPCTRRRLLSSYLLHRDGDDPNLSVVFCELSAPPCAWESTRLTLYRDHRCEVWVADIHIAEYVVCCEVVGVNCSCFVVGCHHFVAHSVSLRKVWLKALNNIKVKLQNRAPFSDEEELHHYREAIREQIRTCEATLETPKLGEVLLPGVEKTGWHNEEVVHNAASSRGADEETDTRTSL